MDNRKEARTYAFILVSIFTHLALAAGVLTLNTSSKKLKPSTSTQVEVLSAEGAQAPALEPVIDQAPLPAKVSKPAEAPKVSQKPAAAPVQSPVRISRSLPAKTAAQAKPALSGPSESAPAMSEDTPSDENSEVAVAAGTQAKAGDREESVDPTEAAQAEMAALTEQALKEKEAQADALQQEAAQDSERLAQEHKSKYDQQREALSAAAAERMAQEAQAERMAEESRRAEAARQAEEARLAEQKRLQSLAVAKSGSGSGSEGSQSGAGGSEVRSLSELKQLPGNARPQYDSEDRLKGRQGEVAFLAYVSAEGMLTEFKMLQSSGHRQLDAKTLKAIRNWKFYPGQEGWVEIPFRWDLKGGPQEMPTGLRRRAQVSPSTGS